MDTIKAFTKFTNKPGTCTIEEVKLVRKFLNTYLKYKSIYKRSTGSDPIGMSIEATLQRVDWYENFLGDTLKRTKNDMQPKVHNKYHKTAPSTAIYIGRGSKYGNPFQIGVDGNRDQVCDKYEIMVESNKKLKTQFIKELKGKDLVCFCSPKRCHGDYLLKISNKKRKLKRKMK